MPWQGLVRNTKNVEKDGERNFLSSSSGVMQKCFIRLTTSLGAFALGGMNDWAAGGTDRRVQCLSPLEETHRVS